MMAIELPDAGLPVTAIVHLDFTAEDVKGLAHGMARRRNYLGSRKHGETSLILEVMTRDHGRHLGLVRGGRSRKSQPVLQAGNRVDIVWRARLDEHLGMFQVEALEFHAARLFESAVAVFGLQTLAAHIRLMPERDAHPSIFETLNLLVQHLDEPSLAGELVARFELLILDELGFGLDLTQCAATGTRTDLVYVSPKSGRAVSRQAGAPWSGKLLALPSFLMESSRRHADETALDDAFRLTGFFFARHVYEPRGIEAPEARAGFLAALRRQSVVAMKQLNDDAA